MTIKEWFTANEIAALPYTPNCGRSVRLKAQSKSWSKRKCEKGKGFEYHIDSLPLETQAFIRVKNTGGDNLLTNVSISDRVKK
ncbi:DNA-binding protein [uncultured Shewanella sp.]|uniref:DNA-binding protein n=1 Tax=uncultured Shewanella sp. TaxID=173975 RepID=UPI002601A96E|nr:DNA-binding protein [uncultured Shewanella sp.]